MLWIFYSLLAAMFWAIVNVTDKYTMAKLVDKPIIPLMVLALVGVVVAVVIYFLHGFASFTPFHLMLVFLAGLFYVLAMLFYYLALKHEEVSKVIPIFYLAPVIILLIAIEMLNENLTSSQYWGIAFLVGGAILISTTSSWSLKGSKGVGFMLVAAFCYALNQVLTKYLLINNEFWSVFATIRIAIFLSLLPVFCWYYRPITSYCKTISYRAYEIMTINQIFNLMGVFAITLAMTSGYVSLVNALASIQPFFVLVLTLLLSFFLPNTLKESLEGWILIKKFFATIMIFIGVLIIS